MQGSKAYGMENENRLKLYLERADAFLKEAASRMRYPDGAIAEIARLLVKNFPSQIAAIWLFTDVGEQWQLAASVGAPNRDNDKPPANLNIDLFIKQPQPAINRDIEEFIRDRNRLDRSDLSLVSGFPLLVGDRLIGLLTIFSDKPLDAELELVLMPLARALAIIIDNCLPRATATAPERLARQEAQERVAELEAIIAQMAEGVIVLDSIGRVLSINPRGRELLGVSAVGVALSDHARVYNLYRLDGELFHDADLPFARAVQGETIKDFEILVRPSDRPERVISINAAPLLNTTEQIIGAVAAFHDISDRIRYQRVLEQNNERLIEVDHLKTRFISTVSHELRTPLNAIIGLVQLLQRDKSAPLTERQLDMVSRVAANSKQLMMLINDLLDYSRLASGKEKINLTRFSAVNLIEQVWVGLIDSAISKGLDCYKEIEELGEVEGDYTKAHLVLTNLLGNAIKYTQHGSIWLRAALVDEQFWCVEVRDSGPGIASEDLQSIFDEFSRSRNAEMGKVTGSGLGLPISKKMVELMGGRIEAESIFGRGSTFRVIWPREVGRFIAPELIAGHSQS